MIHKEIKNGELYVYFKGKLLYKRWLGKKIGSKRQPSLLFNVNGWPNVWITSNDRSNENTKD